MIEFYENYIDYNFIIGEIALYYFMFETPIRKIFFKNEQTILIFSKKTCKHI